MSYHNLDTAFVVILALMAQANKIQLYHSFGKHIYLLLMLQPIDYLHLLKSKSFPQAVAFLFSYAAFDWKKDFEADYLEQIQYYCLVMSEEYIRTHFADIQEYANVIEKRLADDCTLERILADNKLMLELAKQYGVNYILIDDKYEITLERWRYE